MSAGAASNQLATEIRSGRRFSGCLGTDGALAQGRDELQQKVTGRKSHTFKELIDCASSPCHRCIPPTGYRPAADKHGRGRHMRYRVRGLWIQSELAAKSIRKPSRPLVHWIRENVSVQTALDYGCGRLRYTPYLARICRQVHLVDSDEQLSREVRIGRTSRAVRAHAAARWPTAEIHSLAQFWRGRLRKYDFVLCANVISAIPSRRLRSRSLNSIRRQLSPNGRLLVVNQHTNSYFTAARKSPKAIQHLDGWILDSRKGPAYFGVISREKSIALLQAHRFRILKAWIEGQSNYILAAL
jgi:2-polyprenyl-3-methyl-5-hydroxy-6-metoxy-1,4-benzoquinol methylase